MKLNSVQQVFMGHPVHVDLIHFETRTSNPPNPVSHLVSQQVTPVFPTAFKPLLMATLSSW